MGLVVLTLEHANAGSCRLTVVLVLLWQISAIVGNGHCPAQEPRSTLIGLTFLAAEYAGKLYANGGPNLLTISRAHLDI